MNHDTSRPADTRMMGIVHDALRRDLGRVLDALRSSPPQRQREAIGRHVEWMMQFLHTHHQGEDTGLWPLVRRRDPSVGDLLDRMESDHRLVAPLVEECTDRARAYAASADDTARLALADALERLSSVLLPHLRREEDDVMPLVAVTISAAEWKAVDREHYLDGKSITQLGFEGHWLLDGLDAERAEVVTHQVPPLQRVVLVHGFSHRYHRYATGCWGEAGGAAYRPAPRLARRVRQDGRVEVVVDAAVDDVWAVVRDVTRTPQWSLECRKIEWLDGATEAAPGARFRGENRAGPFTWRRVNEVVEVRAPNRFVWRTVPSRGFPDSTEWSFELEPTASGTRVVQAYRVLRAPRVLSFVYAVMVPTHRDRSSELGEDLRRLGQVAAGRSTQADAERATN
jgi:hemerythrin-like domain-containing protein/uncharacterized membrane protein